MLGDEAGKDGGANPKSYIPPVRDGESFSRVAPEFSVRVATAMNRTRTRTVESISLNLETLFLTALFSLAAVAFIGVLNARGLWRTLVAALLALFCLGVALWQTAGYRAMLATRDLAPHAETSSVPDSETLSGMSDDPGAGGGNTNPANRGELGDLLAAARALFDSLAAEEPARARALSDSAYQAFDGRAAAYLAQARMLRERAARVAAAPPSPGLEEVAELLTVSLQSQTAAARDLHSFFRANGRDEEQRLLTAFRRGIEAAGPPLGRAEARAGSEMNAAGARNSDFEAP
jgi:hypothetical protein